MTVRSDLRAQMVTVPESSSEDSDEDVLGMDTSAAADVSMPSCGEAAGQEQQLHHRLLAHPSPAEQDEPASISGQT